MTASNPNTDDLSLAQLIWDYHQMHHVPRHSDVGIALGSHDLGVPTYASQLYHAGLFPLLVFTGANSPTTRRRFPRGEAVHFAEKAEELGVPQEAVLVEPNATNTGDNMRLSRTLLASHGVFPKTTLLISKPYMERRAYATCRAVWPEVEPICTSAPLDLESYISEIGDAKLVIDMLVGDLQRIIEYPRRGFAIEQEVPDDALDAYRALVERGYTSRLMADAEV